MYTSGLLGLREPSVAQPCAVDRRKLSAFYFLALPPQIPRKEPDA